MKKTVPSAKAFIRAVYRYVIGLHTLISIPFSNGKGPVRVFYGGARTGDTGGPLVKIKRLRQYFPECQWKYNLVYGLSNAPYLPRISLRLLKLRGVPIVINQNGVYYPAWFAENWQAYNARMSHAYHLADYVFWQSEFCRQAADIFLGTRTGPGEILYNAVDTSRFVPSALDYDCTSQPYRFLLTGVIDFHLYYRLESTLKALANARTAGLDCQLDIAGIVAPEAIALASGLIEQLNIVEHVRFCGPYTQDQAPEIYKKAHAYIMMKHNDPCPNTVIEALACGLPVVYSDTGGVGELVGPCGMGIACEESWDEAKVPETKAVAEGMLFVAKHHATLSRQARDRAVAKFDIANWISRHKEIFEQLIAERS